MIGYVTLEETKEYLELRFENIPSDVELSRSLQLAFDKIELIDVRGRGETKNFPRICEEFVPSLIKQAQMLEAYTMSITKSTGAEKSDNIISKTVGDFSVTYSENKVQGVEFFNKVALDIMNKYRRKGY